MTDWRATARWGESPSTRVGLIDTPRGEVKMWLLYGEKTDTWGGSAHLVDTGEIVAWLSPPDDGFYHTAQRALIDAVLAATCRGEDQP